MGSRSKSTSSSQYSWSALPIDLLSNIANILDTRIDVLRFRAVCHSWRSSIPQSSKFQQSIELPFRNEPNYCSPLLLIESRVYALQPLVEVTENETKTWIIKIQESSESDRVILKDLLSTDSFPYDHLKAHLPRVLNLLDYTVVEIRKDHEVQYDIERGPCECNGVHPRGIMQTAISSDIDKLDDGFAAMVLHVEGKLSVWRKGNEEWTYINDNRGQSRYSSIICYNRKFFAVDVEGVLLIVDPVSLDISSISLERTCGLSNKFLVESLGDLFLVDLDFDYFCGPSLLKVYKLNGENRNWVEVDELKDQAFFLNYDKSFSVPARDFTGCKGNCVYLVEGCGDHPGFGAEIYNLDYATFRPLSEFPGYRKILWPPPTWLKRNASSS